MSLKSHLLEFDDTVGNVMINSHDTCITLNGRSLIARFPGLQQGNCLNDVQAWKQTCLNIYYHVNRMSIQKVNKIPIRNSLRIKKKIIWQHVVFVKREGVNECVTD